MRFALWQGAPIPHLETHLLRRGSLIVARSSWLEIVERTESSHFRTSHIHQSNQSINQATMVKHSECIASVRSTASLPIAPLTRLFCCSAFVPNVANAARFNSLHPKCEVNVHKTHSLVKDCEGRGGIPLCPLAKACGCEPGSHAFSCARKFLADHAGLKGKMKKVTNPTTGETHRLKFFHFDIEPQARCQTRRRESGCGMTQRRERQCVDAAVALATTRAHPPLCVSRRISRLTVSLSRLQVAWFHG